MRFENWRYLSPPRPDSKGAIASEFLQHFEQEGWIAQAKLNGTGNVMGIAPDRRTIKALSRHNDPHKLWSPSTHTAKPFQELSGNGWYVFVCELMHSKVSGGPRDINYVNDILVADGDYLVGSTFAARQTMLYELFHIKPAKNDELSHYVIDEHTWLARNHTTNFLVLYEALQKPYHEGLVLKKPLAKLALCSKEGSNTSWQVKCRRGGKNFSF